MKPGEISSRIKLLVSLEMPVEALKVLLLDLAVELDGQERTRAGNVTRKSQQRARDIAVTSAGHCRDIAVTNGECHADVTPRACIDNNSNNLPNPIFLESPPPPKTTSSKPLSADFEKFWSAYPKRAGAADRKAAAKAFSAALKRTDFKTLLWAAEKYAAEMQVKGKVDTEYVKQARTWLNADGWTEYGHVGEEAGSFIPTRIAVFEDSEAWRAWKTVNPRITARDIRVENGGVKRGWYFPSEWPPESTEQRRQA